MDPPSIDQVALAFSPATLALLNVVLALVTFGVALDIRVEDFRRVARTGRPALLGLAAQLLLLPGLTFGLVLLLDPVPSMALGMILVASCPGGTISNFMTHLAGGSTALSVTMSAVSTAAATVTLPLHVSLWGSLHPGTRALLTAVEVEPIRMFFTVLAVIGLPVLAGMALAVRRPWLAERLRLPMRRFSLAVFALFVAGALAANFEPFLAHVGRVAGLVAAHNALALGLGWASARLGGLPAAERRAVTIEVGIQNSGLGLLLIFDFFDGLGGMAIVAAWWGVWHIVSGLALAAWWSRRPLAAPAGAAG